MSLATDIDTDYTIMDNVQTVSVIIKKSNTNDVRLESVKGLAQPFSKRDFAWAGSIAISPEDVVWNLWNVSLVSGVTITPGCWIAESDGTNWIIMLAELETLGTRWRCMARKARVNE